MSINDNTPLSVAAPEKHLDAVSMLITRGAGNDATDTKGEIALVLNDSINVCGVNQDGCIPS